VDAGTSATMARESVIMVIIQLAPTVWIIQPNCDRTDASQMFRNDGVLRGPKVERVDCAN
jgi:hypothetical protein